MIESNSKIEPLREDLGRIIPPSFLLSTPYKRWLVSRKLDNLWKRYILAAKEDGYPSFSKVSYHEYIANKALTLLLN